MDRRELLKMIAIATGGVVVGGEFFLTGCKLGSGVDAGFTEKNIAFLNEVGETIIPATSTPGAKDVNVGEFMKLIVTDCYKETDQKIFMDGIGTLNDECKKMHNHNFMESTPEQRKKLLIILDKDASAYMKAKDKKDPTHYFTMIKQLTLTGYFTSKEGATKALRHVAVPGKYDGAFPYKKGDKAWHEG